MAPFSLLLCVPLTKHEVYFCHFMLIICTRIYLQVLFTLFHFIFLFFFLMHCRFFGLLYSVPVCFLWTCPGDDGGVQGDEEYGRLEHLRRSHHHVSHHTRFPRHVFRGHEGEGLVRRHQGQGHPSQGQNPVLVFHPGLRVALSQASSKFLQCFLRFHDRHPSMFTMSFSVDHSQTYPRVFFFPFLRKKQTVAFCIPTQLFAPIDSPRIVFES